MKLAILLIVSCINIITYARDIPLSLAENISEQTAVVTNIPPEMWEKEKYTGITIKISDVIIDDSGTVHIIIDEHRRHSSRSWFYLKFDKNGNELIRKKIYTTKYINISEDFLVSRLLLNPDGTILVFYPDSEWYTCWMKLDKKGNVIEKNEPRWWRGDTEYNVCLAGQDSFHIVTFPVDFRGKTIKQTDPVGMEPSLIFNLYYSNNFFLRGKRIKLRSPYTCMGIPLIIGLPNKNIFCFTKISKTGYTWTMDIRGNCYDADGFNEDSLAIGYLSKVDIDTVLKRFAGDMQVHLNWGDNTKETWQKYFFEGLSNIKWWAAGLFSDSAIGVGMYYNHAFYLLKYDLAGQIIEKDGHEGKLVDKREMDKDLIFPFIKQFIIPERHGPAIDKTIFYWGFDDEGNFFLELY